MKLNLSDHKRSSSDLPDVYLHSHRSSSENETDRDRGVKAFNRFDDGQRLNLLKDLVAAWLNGAALNDEAVAGAFRQAWSTEPYLEGVRWGSYFSALAAASEGGANWSMDEIADSWGDRMMDEEERRELANMAFPIKIYRGGRMPIEELVTGVSWTIDLTIARFYAHVFPRRWSAEASGFVIMTTIERHQSMAFFQDRKEAEMLVSFLEMNNSVAEVSFK